MPTNLNKIKNNKIKSVRHLKTIHFQNLIKGKSERSPSANLRPVSFFENPDSTTSASFQVPKF